MARLALVARWESWVRLLAVLFLLRPWSLVGSAQRLMARHMRTISDIRYAEEI